jgi:uncharacterized protein YecE (DUF72 family)
MMKIIPFYFKQSYLPQSNCLMKKILAPFYSGVSGLQLPIPKYLFPEPFKNFSRLTYYSFLYNSIEINSSFYKIPQPPTVSKWNNSVAKNFRFTFKLWKEITHSKELKFNQEDVKKFFKSINSVENKKGCLLIQFPKSTGNEYFLQLEKLLTCIKEITDGQWKIAVEFRNKLWYNDYTYKLLNIFNAALVIHDMPKSATPMILHKSDFMYIRFHGPTGNYGGSYSEDFLKKFADSIKEWRKEGKKVYVYFNNTMGDALKNLNTLNSFMSK